MQVPVPVPVPVPTIHPILVPSAPAVDPASSKKEPSEPADSGREIKAEPKNEAESVRSAACGHSEAGAADSASAPSNENATTHRPTQEQVYLYPEGV